MTHSDTSLHPFWTRSLTSAPRKHKGGAGLEPTTAVYNMYRSFSLVSVQTHQCSLVRVDAERGVYCDHQSPVVFVPAVGGRRHTQFVLTVELQA